jgi:hypothetical protein
MQRRAGKLRILVLAQNLPYPTFAGLDLRNWQNVNGLMKVGQVGVFGLCSQDPRAGKVMCTATARFTESSRQKEPLWSQCSRIGVSKRFS